jgi:hypothetical protein
MKQLIILLNLSCLLLLAGCHKDDFPGTPPTAKPHIAIALNTQYISAAKVDSAVLVWEVNGEKKTIKMQLRNDSLTADITQFQEGSGKFSFEVFSTIKLSNQYKLQWVQEKTISLSHTNPVNISGPSGYNDANWKPRVRLEDVNNHVAVVALRPEDPYFFVKGVPNNVLTLTVSREYWKTIGGLQIIAGGEWGCANNCRDENGNVVNNTFFSNLPQQIGNKQWNHLEIIVLYVTDRHGGGSVLSLTHDVN